MENKKNKVNSPNEEGGGGVMGYKIKIDTERCNNCGVCTIRCPFSIFKIEKGVLFIDREKVIYCNGCNRCGIDCEMNAITVS